MCCTLRVRSQWEQDRRLQSHSAMCLHKRWPSSSTSTTRCSTSRSLLRASGHTRSTRSSCRTTAAVRRRRQSQVDLSCPVLGLRQQPAPAQLRPTSSGYIISRASLLTAKMLSDNFHTCAVFALLLNLFPVAVMTYYYHQLTWHLHFVNLCTV